jgi:hypothetical protein
MWWVIRNSCVFSVPSPPAAAVPARKPVGIAGAGDAGALTAGSRQQCMHRRPGGYLVAIPTDVPRVQLRTTVEGITGLNSDALAECLMHLGEGAHVRLRSEPSGDRRGAGVVVPRCPDGVEGQSELRQTVCAALVAANRARLILPAARPRALRRPCAALSQRSW